MKLLEQISLLKWDLRKQEYKNIFSDKKWLPDHPTQNAIAFSDSIDNRQVSVSAYFLTDNQDKLGKIGISFEDIQTDIERKDIYENLVRTLSEKYGDFKYSTTMPRINTPIEYRFSESIRWATDDTIVEATLILSECGSPNPGLGIIFYDKKNDPLMKEFPDYASPNYESSPITGKNFRPLSEEQINQIKKATEDK
ncbi:MAG: hypothetical protein WC441_01865 [Patescibacteria group bacterium]